jgi:hypothetical protein
MPHLREQENTPKQNAPDEIDLVVIFGYIRSFFRSILRSINYTLLAIGNNFLIVAFIVLAGLGLSYLVFYTTKPFYTSSMTLMLANIRNEFIKDQLDKLSIMIGESNVEAVADRLDISPEAAKQIREMKFSNLDEERVEEDSVLTGSPFRIELSLYDRELFDSMEPAITNFLENNRYFAKQKRIKQRQIENMISKLGGEISSIDSMKSTVGSPRGPVNGFVYGQPVDPTNLYRESISMYKEQVQLEASLEQLDNVEVVTGFAPRLLPTGPSLRKYLAIGASVALILGVLVGLNLEGRKRKRKGL